jgi:hypothetical protein
VGPPPLPHEEDWHSCYNKWGLCLIYTSKVVSR